MRVPWIAVREKFQKEVEQIMKIGNGIKPLPPLPINCFPSANDLAKAGYKVPVNPFLANNK